MPEAKCIHVSEVKDITVYPQFCRLEDKQMIYNLPGICEEDDGTVAFITREDKDRYLTRVRMQKFRESRRMPPEEYERRKREGERRRCKK